MEPAAIAASQRVTKMSLCACARSCHACRAVPAPIARFARTDAVNDSANAGNLAADRLRGHLQPDLLARLAATGTLPPPELRAACVRMRSELAALATYIPPVIVREQLARPAPGRVSGAYWDGSVLFADLSGFTALSERLSSLGKQGAEEISAIINNLFDALVEEIHRYCGGLLKFGGDAITAFFDALTLGEQHAALAARAALAMQERMAAFAALETRAGIFGLRLRIGVHSGRVFAAQVGDHEHIELVVTGRNINRVALAQEIADPGEVVISEATGALLPQSRVEPRQSGFFLLQRMDAVVPPMQEQRWGWRAGAGDLAELFALAERIDALRPYLPRGLPRRFLEPSTDGTKTGEFRPVTVVFANFFPFSAMLDRFGDDSGAAAHVLNAYYRRAQEVIHRYGGIVNKVDMYTFGDKLMALFGAPIAHEDDPLRAVRAAIELRTALADANAEITSILNDGRWAIDTGQRTLKTDRPTARGGRRTPVAFAQRIGINTGVVFAGQVGSARRHEYTVMGQPVNLAARLMAVAEESAIVLSPTIRRAVERHIALRDLPPLRLKGIAEPVPLAEALHTFEIAQPARRSAIRPALVGRATELEQMTAAARAALAGSGRVVALVGEAGAGKTRLIEEVLHHLVLLSGRSPEGVPAFLIYSAECQSYEQNTPYAAIRELLRQLLRPADDHASEPDALLRRTQELAPAMARFAPLLADLLGFPIADTPLTAALTPEQRHDRAQELVEAVLLAAARAQPLVLIVDDLHWADASSLDLLARLARRAESAAVLIVLGYRPDPPIPEPWRDLAHCSYLSIRELPPESSTTLVRALLGGEPPPELAVLIDKAQGNPFFIEEVVRSLLESGVLQRDANGWQLVGALDEAAVPDSIEGVITARLDRLEEQSREVLQVASVIGRRFPYPVLSGVVPRREELPTRLAQLAEATLILLEDGEAGWGADSPARPSYVFKHALTRDVAYEAILYARRRELHRCVAQQIERLHAGRLDEQLALLARHYLLAEDWAPALDYHLRAARQAQARYANREAIALYERALQIAGRLRPTTDRVERRGAASAAHAPTALVHADLAMVVIEILEQLGVIHALIGEYDLALGHYQEALARLRSQPEALIDSFVRLYHQIARVYEKRAEFETAFAWVERAMVLAGDNQSQELVRCLLLGAGLHKRQGRYAQTLEWGERALQMATQLGSVLDQAQALKLLGSTYLNLGDTTRALELATRSLELYRQVQDLDGLSNAHNDLANIYYELGRLAEARAHYEAGAEIKQTIGDVYGQAMIANNLGDLLRLQNKLGEAIDQYRRSLAIFERLGSQYGAAVLHMNLGAAHLAQNDLELAEQHLRRSASLFDQAGAEDFLPELERYLAELHLRRGNLAEARLACELALATAARLEARAEEGVARRSLGQILAQGGDLDGAWEELQQSLAILREASSTHETARTLVALAALAPALGRHAEGQAALDEALPILRELGAQRDLDEARAIAAQHGYTLSGG
jgi:predicted ATPase/class 3 adenylate cyclase